MTQVEGLRWIQAATSDLDAAQALLEDGYYHLCAFHAQQAAEKALKGWLRVLGRIPWGHSSFTLLSEVNSIVVDLAIQPELFDSAQRLDGHYIPSRYPDAFPSGVPADHYNEVTALQAVDDASTLLEFVNNNLP